MVKRSRLQSSEKPIRRSCREDRAAALLLPAPDARLERLAAQVFLASCPSVASWRSTTICVAMPAWSRPGSQSVSKPLMRFQRTITSCSVLVNAWPMCSEPVTLGGGITTQNGGLPEAGSARKKPCSSQNAYQRRSTSFGS